MKNKLFWVSLLLLIFMSYDAHALISDNLLEYWKMEETGQIIGSLGRMNSGSNSFTQNVTGVINNGKNYSTALGSLTLFSANDILDFTVNESFTLSFWVKLNDSSDVDLIHRRQTNNNAHNFNAGIYTGNLSFSYYDGSRDNIYKTTSPSPFVGQWTHVVITHTFGNGSLTKYYINGVLQNGTWALGNGSSNNVNSAAFLLEFSPQTYNYFAQGYALDGGLDEIGIWNKTVTSSEVSSLYNRGLGFSYPFAAEINSINISSLEFGNISSYIFTNISGDNVTFVNITIKFPNGSSSYFNTSLTNGLYFTSAFTILNGTYYVNVSSNSINFSTNYTINNTQQINSSPSNLFSSPGQNFTINISINTNTSYPIYYNFTCTIPNANFTCLLLNNITINNSGSLNVTITTTTNLSDGVYYTNITTRRVLDNLMVSMNLSLTITTLLGNPVVLNASNSTIAIYSNDIVTANYNLSNNGTYNLSNCTGTLDNSFVGWSFYSFSSNVSVIVNSSKNFSITFSSPPVGAYSGYLQITCNATPLGIYNSLQSSNKPLILLSSSSPPAPSTGGGGGGSVPTPTASDVKIDCNVSLSKATVILTEDDSIIDIRVTNGGTSTYSPTFSFEAIDGNEDVTSSLFITNKIVSVLQGQSETFGVRYSSGSINANTSSNVNLILSNDVCLDESVKIIINIGQPVSIFDLFSESTTIGEFITTPVFSEFFNVGVIFAIWMLIWSAMFFGNYSKAFKEGKPLVVLSWVIFSLLLSAFLTIVVMAIVKL